MENKELRNQIIEIFERNRQSPNSPFDKFHFLDYLLNPPASENNIKNSFRGVKRYNQFFEDVEQTFRVCFTLSDQDRFYSVDQFVKKTKERIGNSRGNKMIIKRRMEEKDHYYIELILTIILVLIIAYLKIHIVLAIALSGYGIAIWWIVGSKIRSKRHNRMLYKKIMGNESNE